MKYLKIIWAILLCLFSIPLRITFWLVGVPVAVTCAIIVYCCGVCIEECYKTIKVLK